MKYLSLYILLILRLGSSSQCRHCLFPSQPNCPYRLQTPNHLKIKENERHINNFNIFNYLHFDSPFPLKIKKWQSSNSSHKTKVNGYFKEFKFHQTMFNSCASNNENMIKLFVTISHHSAWFESRINIQCLEIFTTFDRFWLLAILKCLNRITEIIRTGQK